ncbi:MAG: hypothetical protein O9315_17905 [Beijerinckiaceae bacterium]|nr:hypothetical protein [Brevundimonas sp.]MCZ8302115.1 hypothetical protein [Beijerinckiaceae bacterium]
MILTLVRAALPAVFVALLSCFAMAGPHSLPVDAPVVAMTFPDDWDVQKTNRLIEVTSKAGDMYVSYMIVGMQEFTRAMKTWDAWAGDQKIKLDDTNKSVKKFQFEGHDSISHRWTGSDENGPTIVMRTILKLSEDKLVFITEWGSVPATQKYSTELQMIRRSVTKLR